MKLNAEEKIRKARIQLQKTEPFFSYLVVNLKLREKEGFMKQVGGWMGVDYKGNLYYDPDEIKKIKIEVIKGMLCHEVMHLALEHLMRQDNRNQRKWNIATDYAINYIVKENGLRLPENVLYNKKYAEMSAEEIYDELPESKPKTKSNMSGDGQSDGNSDGSGQSSKNGDSTEQGNGNIVEIDGENVGRRFDEHVDPEDSVAHGSNEGDEAMEGKNKGSIAEEMKKEAEKWKRKMIQADQHAQMQGNSPAGIERFVDNLYTEKIGWSTKLHKYIQSEVQADYTWKMPSKGYHATGVYQPSSRRENIEVIVAVDTSGSISDKELTQFMTELNAINNSFSQISITILIGDAKLQEKYELSNKTADKFEDIKIKGYGGTDHRWIYEWIKNNKRNAKVVVNFTDGYTSFPEDRPSIDTIWVSTGGEEEHYPFGSVIEMDIED